MIRSILVLLVVICFGQQVFGQSEMSVNIPTGGNTWYAGPAPSPGFNGEIKQWTEKATKFTTYFRLSKTGNIQIKLHAKVYQGISKLRVMLNGKESVFTVQNTDWNDIAIGTWDIKDTGYQKLMIEGMEKQGTVFADIDHITLSGLPTKGEMSFTPNNQGNFFYWGRRGPSVHLSYHIPEKEDIEWFYNEVTIPKGMDPVGSYFMANGFSVGYFGFQVNSASTRHVLFSVWSPYATNNPGEIPDKDKIHLLAKGDGVHAGAFGGEGSGGQSYMDYPWETGKTYKFLLHAHPNADSTTDFTAYFFAPEVKKWMLIAGFKRPGTKTWLTHLHSFTENFNPDQGNITRMATYNNEWVCTENGVWMPLTQATFTGDETAGKNYRKDYAGGTFDHSFFLKNGGFFSDYVPLRSSFVRPASTNVKPEIDFKTLPQK